uniref:Zinc transporter ZIP2 (inferred by orthology to a human protein) n=1 Tax=Strongyloides venezuelensis TaxID=75913 RepID=A0A0K0G3E1_STRVS
MKTNDGLETGEMDKKHAWILSLLSCFAGGVFLATCLLDIFPHINENFSSFKKNANWDFHYPMPEFIACLGFFIIFFIEEITIKVFKNMDSPHGHAHFDDYHSDDEICYDDEDSHTTNTPPHGTNNISRLTEETTASSVETPEKDDEINNTVTESAISPNTDQNQPIKHISIVCHDPDSIVDKLSINTLDSVKFKKPENDNIHESPVILKVDSQLETSRKSSKRSSISSSHRSRSIYGGSQYDEEYGEEIPPHYEEHVNAVGNVLKSITFTLIISVHSVLEGFALGVQNKKISMYTLFASLVLHKGVEAFSVGLQVAKTNLKRKRFVVFSIMIYSLTTPLGALLGVILRSANFNIVLKDGLIFVFESLAAGTFLYVTFFEILAHEKANKFNTLKQLLAIFIGFLMISLVQMLEQTLGAHSHEHEGGHRWNHSHQSHHLDDLHSDPSHEDHSHEI